MAKPFTGPIAKAHSRMDAANVTVSAVTMVWNARWKATSTAGRNCRPLRCSSLIRSKNTMYESAVMPIDTMIPVTPANVSVVPWNSPSRMRLVNSRRAEHGETDHGDEAERPVVEHHRHGDQDQSAETGEQAGPKRVVAERCGNRYLTLAFEGGRERTVSKNGARSSASASGSSPPPTVMMTLPASRPSPGGTSGETCGAENTTSSTTIASWRRGSPAG